jgi:hypothetical protein
MGIYADLFKAVVYGILYLLFTTFTFVFQQSYGFSESTGYVMLHLRSNVEGVLWSLTHSQ